MNSETKFILGLVALGAMVYFIGENKKPQRGVSIAPSRFESPLTRLHYLSDSLGIKPKEEKEKKNQWYKYRVEIETIPENQIYKIEKSGYQQYEVSRLGETYSYVTYEFISDRIMTTEEAYDFVKRHPENVPEYQTLLRKTFTMGIMKNMRITSMIQKMKSIILQKSSTS